MHVGADCFVARFLVLDSNAAKGRRTRSFGCAFHCLCEAVVRGRPGFGAFRFAESTAKCWWITVGLRICVANESFFLAKLLGNHCGWIK